MSIYPFISTVIALLLFAYFFKFIYSASVVAFVVSYKYYCKYEPFVLSKNKILNAAGIVILALIPVLNTIVALYFICIVFDYYLTSDYEESIDG